MHPITRRPQLSLGLRSFSAHDPGGWSHLRAQAEVADGIGIDRVVVSDHVAFGEDLSAYGDPRAGGTEGGRQPTGPDGHWLEPLTVLSWVAGITRDVRLGTNILLAALRRPVVLAKQLATLDVLSDGRLDIGVGVGWQRAEYEAAGLDFASRGDLLDHSLSVCRTLWTEDRATHHDELSDFDGIHQMPKPLQGGGVPIWVGGSVQPRMLRRLAAFGSGWIPWGPAAQDPGSHVATVKRSLEQLGREDADRLQVTASLPAVSGPAGLDVAATVDAMGPLVDAGITDFRTRWSHPEEPERDRDGLAELARAVHEAF